MQKENLPHKEVLNIAKKIIAIDSRNASGTLRLARFVGGELKKIGFNVYYQKQNFFGARQANVIASIGPRKGKVLLLNTHLDTVATHKPSWTKTGGNPFRATVKKGKLYGLGSADTKLALACQITALKTLNPKSLKCPLLITGTYGEEVGLVGVQKLVLFLKNKKIATSLVVNSEPTSLAPCLGNKGFRVYHLSHFFKESKRKEGYLARVIFTGKSGHSAYPDQGINAIFEALRWVNRLPKKCQVVSMNGGLAANIIPSKCEVTVWSSVAWVPMTKKFGGKTISITKEKNIFYAPKLFPMLKIFLKRYKTYLASLSSSETSNIGLIRGDLHHCEITCDARVPHRQKRAPFLRSGIFKITKIKDNPAYSQDPQQLSVKKFRILLRKIGLKNFSPMIKAGCTEAGHLSKLGRTVITFGPGTAVGNAHQPNEFVKVKELFQATRFYQRLIEEWCYQIHSTP